MFGVGSGLKPVCRSIVNRFCKDHFATSYKQTIGLDFFMKRVVLPGVAGDNCLSVMITTLKAKLT